MPIAMINLISLYNVLMSSGGGSTSVGFTDISDILTAVTTQFSVSNIVAVIAGILGVTTAFVFLWWGVRKAYRAIIAGTTRGRARI